VDAPSGALALEDEKLVAKRENLGLELRARPQQRSNRSQESQKGRRDIESTFIQRDENINHFKADGNSEGAAVRATG